MSGFTGLGINKTGMSLLLKINLSSFDCTFEWERYFKKKIKF